MSDDISSSPTCVERPAASLRSSPVRQPLRRKITYVFMSSLPGSTPRSYDRLHPRTNSGAARDQDVFEVLARAAARAAVDVAAVTPVEPEAGTLEDLWIELAAVVDDDEQRRACAQERSRALEHDRDPVRVRSERGARGSTGRGAELALAPVVETEQLVGVAMLLVVVDQSGIRRRGDDCVEGTRQLDLERIAVDDLRLVSRAHSRERLQARERIERVATHEAGGVLDGLALAAMLGTPVRPALRRPRNVEIAVRRQPRRSRCSGEHDPQHVHMIVVAGERAEAE